MKSAVIILLVTLQLAAESRTRRKRAWIINTFTIEEEHQGTYPYLLGTISDDTEHGDVLRLTGPGVTEEPIGLFTLNSRTGDIYVNKRLDYERLTILKNDTMSLILEVITQSGVVNQRLAVAIQVEDINDNPPQFSRGVYKTSVEGSTAQETALVMVEATDKDKPETSNSMLDFRIISVTPSTDNVEFFIQQRGDNAVISFKGCLYYEKVTEYTILVEAKDRGEPVQLSSSSTVIIHIKDKNNYMPVLTGCTGAGRVEERESGMTLFRIHVTDKDTEGTAAWRVKYTIKGDKQANFQIETDPKNNDGVLTVIKPLDYEEGSERRLSISVENERPYVFCQVTRKTSTGPWEVIESVASPLSENFTIVVEDANDPPAFTERVKEVRVEENKEIGYPLGRLFAEDRDRFFSSDFVYMKAADPGGWVNVDPKTCQITTAGTLDRESHHVVNNTYTVTVHAVDKGKPPLTGTGTLIIHIMDQNDELPQLRETALSVCLSVPPSVVTLSAFDLDEHPFSGPFQFELQGEGRGKWTVSPTHVNLSLMSRVHTGLHQLQLKVYDLQGRFSLQKLSVATCNCSVTPNCLIRASTGTRASGNAMAIMFFSTFLLLGLLLMSVSVTCKTRTFLMMEDPKESWLSFNVEALGTDCQVPSLPLLIQTDNLSKEKGLGQAIQMKENPDFSFPIKNCISTNGHFCQEDEALWSSLGKVPWCSLTRSLEQSDYRPKVYAYEGKLGTDAELDSICHDEDEADFSPHDLLQLDRKFTRLANILIPQPAPHKGSWLA
ncbi:cadherin-2-like isoform X2 [Conger conger]|uniref:cadherin-2-like isoform X2 n=1 Tax=Conger conger TaxID=82655 RepID=UPI002A5A0721|nr:cadherin-2-like isoform X2 [Conger conger]